MNHYDRQILRIALPAIVTNITVPLLGLVDTAIVGHMGDAAYIGAIAVGSMMFNLIYWLFGFLRMGTSGMTAQAYGREDVEESSSILRQGLITALLVATGILVLQGPLREVMLWLMSPTDDVRNLVSTYFHIVVWGAPAMLGLYVLTGWFIGRQNKRWPMVISISQNVVNIVLSLLLVYGFGMKIEGVALGTLVAQWSGLLIALAFLRGEREEVRWMMEDGFATPHSATQRRGKWKEFFRVNGDLFLRTVCLVAVNLTFTALGARQGDTILAVNALLMQLFLLFSYILDGFAYAGEALGGRYWGAKDDVAFHSVVRRLFLCGGVMTVLFTLTYIIGGRPFLLLLTDEATVVSASEEYVWWAYLIPLCSVAAFIWDGIFIGTTQSRAMLLSAFIATMLFFATAYLTMPLCGNHGLWLALLAFLAARGVVQTLFFQSDKRSMKGKTC